MKEARPISGGLFVATVHDAEGVRLAIAAKSRAELVRRLAEYARRWAVHLLKKDHARYLETMFARGELEAAVEVYFGFVGERWDKEWLVTTVVTSGEWPLASAVVGAVAPPAGSDVARQRQAG